MQKARSVQRTGQHAGIPSTRQSHIKSSAGGCAGAAVLGRIEKHRICRPIVIEVVNQHILRIVIISRLRSDAPHRVVCSHIIIEIIMLGLLTCIAAIAQSALIAVYVIAQDRVVLRRPIIEGEYVNPDLSAPQVVVDDDVPVGTLFDKDAVPEVVGTCVVRHQALGRE